MQHWSIIIGLLCIWRAVSFTLTHGSYLKDLRHSINWKRNHIIGTLNTRSTNSRRFARAGTSPQPILAEKVQRYEIDGDGYDEEEDEDNSDMSKVNFKSHSMEHNE